MDSDNSDIENLLEQELKKEEENDSDRNEKSSSEDEQSENEYEFKDEELDNLAEKDPEFHEWLKSQKIGDGKEDEDMMSSEEEDLVEEKERGGEKDQDEDDGKDESSDDDADDDDEDDAEEESEDQLNSNPNKISEQMLIKLVNKLSKGKVFAFKQLTCMLVSAVEFISSDDEVLKKLQKQSSAGKKSNQNNNSVSMTDLMHQKMGYKHSKEYEISEADDFNAVIMVALNHSYSCLSKILDFEKALTKNKDKDSNANNNENDITTLKNYKKIKGALRVFIECFNELLKRLVDSKSRILLLRTLHRLTLVLIAFPKSCKVILQRLLILWSHYPKNNSSIKDPQSDSNKLRILAFLIISRITSKRPSLSEYAVKEMYWIYQKQIKQTSIHTLPIIDFMTRTMSEMFLNKTLLSNGSSYKSVFLFIRNLALTLRKAIHTQKHDLIYNWSFLHAIRLFITIISQNHTNELEKLIFPIIEISIGAIKLENNNIKNIPFRLHVVESLLSLMKAKNDIFIPIHMLLWPVITLTDRTVDDKLEKSSIRTIIKKNAKEKESGTNKLKIHELRTAWPCMLKFSTAQLSNNTLNLPEILNDKFLTLYVKFISIKFIRESISFVEMFHPILKIFGKYLKTTKIEHFRDGVRTLKEVISRQSDYIGEKRKYVEFNVDETEKVEKWLEGTSTKCPIEVYLDDPSRFVIVKENQTSSGPSKNNKKNQKRKNKDQHDDDEDDIDIDPEGQILNFNPKADFNESENLSFDLENDSKKLDSNLKTTKSSKKRARQMKKKEAEGVVNKTVKNPDLVSKMVNFDSFFG